MRERTLQRAITIAVGRGVPFSNRLTATVVNPPIAKTAAPAIALAAPAIVGKCARAHALPLAPVKLIAEKNTIVGITMPHSPPIL